MRNVLLIILCFLATPCLKVQAQQQQAYDKLLTAMFAWGDSDDVKNAAIAMKASINVQGLVDVNNPPQGFTTQTAQDYNALVNSGNGLMSVGDGYFGDGESLHDQAYGLFMAGWAAYNSGQYYSCLMQETQAVILWTDAIEEFQDALDMYTLSKGEHDEAYLYWIGW